MSDQEPIGWRPGKRDKFVAHLLDLVLKLASPTARRVVTTGAGRAVLRAAYEPVVPTSDVIRGRSVPGEEPKP